MIKYFLSSSCFDIIMVFVESENELSISLKCVSDCVMLYWIERPEADSACLRLFLKIDCCPVCFLADVLVDLVAD